MFIISGVYAHTFIGVGKGEIFFTDFQPVEKILKIFTRKKLWLRKSENRKRNRM